MINRSPLVLERFRIMQTDAFCINGLHKKEISVLLTDYMFWGTHFNELEEYCKENNFKLSGMLITLPNEEAAMLFRLRWS